MCLMSPTDTTAGMVVVISTIRGRLMPFSLSPKHRYIIIGTPQLFLQVYRLTGKCYV